MTPKVVHRPTRWRRVGATAIACLLLGATLAGCDSDARQPEAAELTAEPTAGEWKTWVLSSPKEIAVPPPPVLGSPEADADVAEVERSAESRTPDMLEAVRAWSGPLPTQPWTEKAYEFVSKSAKDPPLSSRNYALVHVAMYDAVIAAWHYKYVYNRQAPSGVDSAVPPGPDPSYPSEHAAIAGAASRVLAFLYPNQSALRLDEMAEQAGTSRVHAGTNSPSDITAGLDLGRAVADKVIAKSKTDGVDRQWDGSRPPGIGGGPEFWQPAPGTASPPTSPLGGTWRPWVLQSGSQLRPPPPPAYGSPAFRAAAQELVDIRNRLTPRQEEIAKFWEGNEGTKLPAGITMTVATHDIFEAATTGIDGRRYTIPRSARAFALLSVALADAGIAAWDAKFTYWNPRPENAIRDLGFDPNWKPFLPTPRFPAYPSGSAGYGGAAETVMTYLFPQRAATFRMRADEQAESRLFAGIHWRYDSVSLDAGREIGTMVVERARVDGADR